MFVAIDLILQMHTFRMKMRLIFFWVLISDKMLVKNYEKPTPGRKSKILCPHFLPAQILRDNIKLKQLALVIGRAKHPRNFRNISRAG